MKKNSLHHCQSSGLRPQVPQGFGIVELIITLAIVAVLMTAAVPSMGSFIKNNRLKSQSQKIFGDMLYARSEAVKLKKTVLLCRSADPQASAPSCGGTARDWSKGWLTYVNQNASVAYEDGTDTLLRVSIPIADTLDIVSDAKSSTYIMYSADGSTIHENSADDGSTVLLAICDDRGGDQGRQVEIVAMGRPVLVVASSGSPVTCADPS